MGANPQLEEMDSSALQSSADLHQLMDQPFVTPTTVITQPRRFTPQLALTPHKAEHFKGAVHNDPTRLSTVSHYPVLIRSCSSSQRGKESALTATPNSKRSFSSLLCIFERRFAFLPTSANDKVINLSATSIPIVTWFLYPLTCTGMRNNRFKRWNIQHKKCYYWDTPSKTIIHSFSFGWKTTLNSENCSVCVLVKEIHLSAALFIQLTVNKIK